MAFARSIPTRGATAFALTLSMLLAPIDLDANDDSIPIGYEFATWLGTGLYRISGRDVWILGLPLRYELRDPDEEALGLHLLLPVSVGWLDARGFDTDDFETATFIPGLELIYRPTPWWTVRPFVQTGIGHDFNSHDSAWIYAGGVRSRMETRVGDYTLALGNAVVAAGSQAQGERSSFARLDVGVSAERPVDWTLGGRGLRVSAFYVASFFSDDASIFTSLDRDRFNLGTVHKVGLALGTEQPLRLLGLRLDWLGLSYLTGDNIEGVRLNAGFPF